MARWCGWLAALLLGSVLLLASPGATRADEGGLPIGPGVVKPLEPIKRMLSGVAWLMAEGVDPRLWLGRGDMWSSLTRVNWGELEGGILGRAGAPPSQAGPGGLVPFRDPAPAFSRDILVTRDFSASPIQTEPSIAVNPKDPDHLLLGTIDYNFPNNSAYVSLDGGVTWQGPQQMRFLREDDISAGDPVVAFDRQGKAYFAFISLGTQEYSVGPLATIAEVSSIALSRSDDGGFTWGEPVSTARSGVTSRIRTDPDGRIRGELTFTFLDKPWMAVGPSRDDPQKDNIYVSYTEFSTSYDIFYVGELPFTGIPRTETTIRLVRSTDGGKTWSDPVAISPTVLTVFGDSGPEEGSLALGRKRVVQGSQVKVAPDGTAYVAWMDSTDDDVMKGLAEMYAARSDNGGKTFTEPIRVAVFNEVAFRPRNAFFRFWATSFAQLAVGPGGEVYIAYGARPSDKENDDADIYLVRSLDKGVTWSSRPIRLNQDQTSRVQFFPAIAVGPNGAIHAMWGDMRDDPREIRYHIYYTQSTDKGETWGFRSPELGISTPDTRATDFPSNSLKGFPNGVFLGDYFSITASKEDVYMVWADTRLGEFGGTNQKIGFTRRRAVPSPEIFLSPPAGAGGRDVTIQGFGFQPDIDVLIQVGGAIVAAERTTDEGRFTSRLFMPLTGEGSQDVNVFDASGNRANASFFTEFGFDSVQTLQKGLGKELGALRKEVEALRLALSAAHPQTGAPTTGAPGVGGTPAASEQPSSRGLSCSAAPGARAGLDLSVVAGALAMGVLLVRRRWWKGS